MESMNDRAEKAFIFSVIFFLIGAILLISALHVVDLDCIGNDVSFIYPHRKV